MKTLLALLLLPTLLFSQPLWSPSQQITSDSVDSFDHSLVEDVMQSSSGKDREIFTYVQHTGNRSEIMVMQTDRGGVTWLPTPTRITNDTIPDGSPVLAVWRLYNGKSRKMLVWKRGADDLYYSSTQDSIWTAPALLATGIYGGEKPCIANVDTNFGAVWVNRGRILFSEFRNNNWSLPTSITPPNDTMNFNPQIKYFPKPMIIWERQKISTTDREIAFTIRNDTGWAAPDTATTLGDNRNPRFLKFMNFMPLVSFESNRWEPYGVFGFSYSNNRWEILPKFMRRQLMLLSCCFLS